MSGYPAAVIGATGYVGGELLRLIAAHPHLELAAAASGSRAGEPIADTFPQLAPAVGEKTFSPHGDWLRDIEPGSTLALFSAAPHGASAAVIAGVIDDCSAREVDVRVVDASADFRYRDAAAYESVYGVPHGAPQLLPDFTCAVPEHLQASGTTHIGHPGCFATAILLAAVPLLQSGLSEKELFVTGITGSTGSGRSPQAGTHHPERHSNLYAYKPLAHRHVPEIVSLVQAATGEEPVVNFVPHSGPFARGIFATVQAKTAVSTADAGDALRSIYGNTPFVRVVEGSPRLKNVVASNRAEIGYAISGDTIVVMSAIDNLVKGAAGGAVQWMNRLLGLEETSGLAALAPAWT